MKHSGHSVLAASYLQAANSPSGATTGVEQTINNSAEREQDASEGEDPMRDDPTGRQSLPLVSRTASMYLVGQPSRGSGALGGSSRSGTARGRGSDRHMELTSSSPRAGSRDDEGVDVVEETREVDAAAPSSGKEEGIDTIGVQGGSVEVPIAGLTQCWTVSNVDNGSAAARPKGSRAALGLFAPDGLLGVEGSIGALSGFFGDGSVIATGDQHMVTRARSMRVRSDIETGKRLQRGASSSTAGRTHRHAPNCDGGGGCSTALQGRNTLEVGVRRSSNHHEQQRHHQVCDASNFRATAERFEVRRYLTMALRGVAALETLNVQEGTVNSRTTSPPAEGEHGTAQCGAPSLNFCLGLAVAGVAQLQAAICVVTAGRRGCDRCIPSSLYPVVARAVELLSHVERLCALTTVHRNDGSPVQRQEGEEEQGRGGKEAWGDEIEQEEAPSLGGDHPLKCANCSRISQLREELNVLPVLVDHAISSEQLLLESSEGSAVGLNHVEMAITHLLHAIADVG